jgi:hypothetical protein
MVPQKKFQRGTAGDAKGRHAGAADPVPVDTHTHTKHPHTHIPHTHRRLYSAALTQALIAVAQLAGGDYDVAGADRVGDVLAVAAVRCLLKDRQVRGLAAAG